MSSQTLQFFRLFWTSLGSLLILLSSEAVAASFDCSKASNLEERLICGDPSLSSLDTQMGTAYQISRQRVRDGNQLLTDQRQWLKERRSCMIIFRDQQAQIRCMRSKTQERLSQLNAILRNSNYLPQQQPKYEKPNYEPRQNQFNRNVGSGQIWWCDATGMGRSTNEFKMTEARCKLMADQQITIIKQQNMSVYGGYWLNPLYAVTAESILRQRYHKIFNQCLIAEGWQQVNSPTCQY